MTREIALFNGGVNNLIDAHLIADNESPISINADFQSGSLKSQRSKRETTTTISGKYGFYYKEQNQLITTDEDRFFVEFGGFLYWSNSAGIMKRYDGTTTSDLGNHAAPTTALGAAAGSPGLLNGTYWYTYTYVHDDLFESPPAGYVKVTLTDTEANITFSDSPPGTATQRKLYRSGGLNPSFNLVATIPIATTAYTDSIYDFFISREELTTHLHDAPPANLDMLVQQNGTFFGALGNKVYFSLEGQPEYWSAYNFVPVPQTITGLGVIGNGIVIFTADSMYLLSGSNMSNISLNKLPYNYGCKDKRSVQNLAGRLIWLSTIDDNDAILSFDGANAVVLTKTATNFNAPVIGESCFDDYSTEVYSTFNYDFKNSAAVHNKYYLFTNGRTIIIDFQDNGKIKYATDTIDSAYLKQGSFFTIEGGKEYEYYPDYSNYRSISYRTKQFHDGTFTQTKAYRVVRVNATGNYQVIVLVDDKEIITTITDKIYLPQGTVGKHISFLIKTTEFAKVKAVAYDYEVLK